MRLAFQTNRNARAFSSVLDKQRSDNLDRALAEIRMFPRGKGGQRRGCRAGVETRLPLERGLGRRAHLRARAKSIGLSKANLLATCQPF